MEHSTGRLHALDTAAIVGSGAARHNRSRRLLQLAFRSGSIYQYTGVPPHPFAELPEADSKGEYFNRNIRNCFPATPLPSSLFNC